MAALAQACLLLLVAQLCWVGTITCASGSVYNRFLQEQYDSDSVAPEPSQPVAPEPSQPVVPEPSQSNGAPRPSQLQDNNFVASAPSQPYLGPSVAPGPSQPYTDKSNGSSRHWSAVVVLISSVGILFMS
ncbi:hypothetical protein WJX79_005690 [Trebouxia sp. C0005]